MTMQIPVLSGVVADAQANFRTSYPMNLVPVPKKQGISDGYLKTADGMIEFASSAYTDRGGINWQGVLYRVAGEFLVRITADQVTEFLGYVENDGKRAIIVNGFDRLAIASAGKLYYYIPGSGVVQVTDADLGAALDVIWAAGYYMTTDGESLVVTDLNDPLSVNPLKYGSSEASPDPVNSLLYIRNEVYAVNRYTVEVFQNVGGSGFPFRRVEGAMIPKGSIGLHASCYYLDNFAFLGGGMNEGMSVYVGGPGQVSKIATAEIEQLLQDYTEEELSSVVLEARADRLHQWLYVHLPDKTAVYDAAASAELQQPVWFMLTSGASGELPYRARNFIRAYDKWIFGDIQTNKFGYFTDADARQFGETVPWQFDSVMLYSQGGNAIVNDLELVRLPGRNAVSPLTADSAVGASVFMSYSEDGMTYSQPRQSSLSYPGQTKKRTTWRSLGIMRNYRTFRFRGMNNPYPDAFARLEAQIEGMGA
jgi:hypothetical protein